MPKLADKPFYFEDKKIDEILEEMEGIISSTRDDARKFDKGVKSPASRIRKQLLLIRNMCHGLRKEVVDRRKVMDAK